MTAAFVIYSVHQSIMVEEAVHSPRRSKWPPWDAAGQLRKNPLLTMGEKLMLVELIACELVGYLLPWCGHSRCTRSDDR